MAAKQSHMSLSVKGGGQRRRESHGELPLRLREERGGAGGGRGGGRGGGGGGRERGGGRGREGRGMPPSLD